MTGSKNMMLFIIVITSITLTSLPVHGESLWRDDGWFADPYSDFKASQPGDTITVVIHEQTSGSGGAQSSGGRSTSIDLRAGTGLFDFIPPAGFSSGTSRSAQRTENRNFSLDGVITCQVVEILENGNLVISGKKEIAINKERETLTLEGIVSPRDISGDNSVLSTRVIDAVVRLDGTLKPSERSGLIGFLGGIFGSVLDFLF